MAAAGVGLRKCIGYKLALEEAVITLAQLHRSFTFALDPHRHPAGAAALELSTGITLSVKGGLWVLPVPRSQVTAGQGAAANHIKDATTSA